MINFEFTRVKTVKAAVDTFQKNKGAQFIAGGTNLVDLMKKGITAPSKLIDISGLPMKEIRTDTRGAHIGALVPNSVAADHPELKSRYPLLSMALNAGASAQLRNMATVGGNIMQRTRCSYFYDIQMPCNKRKPGSGCGALQGYNRMHAIFGASDQCIAVHPSDMCVALAALNARIQVSGPKGNRDIPFEDFHRLPGDTPEKDNNLQAGELITGVYIPSHPYNKSYYLKIRDRLSYAFALVSVAAALEVKNGVIQRASLVMGGVAHKPWRLKAAEQMLGSFTADPGTLVASLPAIADAAIQGAVPYTHNRFKIKLAKAAIQEAILKALNA